MEAIVRNVPQNSSIQFKGLISEASTKKMTPYYPDNWSISVYETCHLLNPETSPESLEEKLRSFLIGKQVSYLRNKDLGIEKEYVVFTRLPRILFREKKEVLTERILQLPAVENVAYSSNVFSKRDGYNYLEMEESSTDLTTLWVDAAFID